MKSSLLTAAAIACALAAVAQAQVQLQKPSLSKNADIDSTRAKDARPPSLSGSLEAASATLGGPGTASVVGPNDACLNATAISGPGTYAFDTVGATTDGPDSCAFFMSNDVWFNFTATATAVYDVRTCGQAAFDTVLTVYNSAACPVGASIACNDDNCGLRSSLTFSATNGSVYKIQVGGYNGENGVGSIVITGPQPPPPPSPDSCAFAATITGSGPHGFNNTAATTGTQGQANSNCTFFNQIGIDNDVWFRWTAPATGNATLSFCAGVTGLDTKAAVYNGSSCPAAQAIACNDDSCGLITELEFCAVSAQQYLFQVGNYPGAAAGTGSFLIVVSPPGSGNDECVGATALGPTGPYAFNTSAATTGCSGQHNANCLAYGVTGMHHDRWFTWTAPMTGIATVTTCGGVTFDSKIAVYQGAGCPAAPAIACNDDACGPQGRQSIVCANVTSGQTYTIQLGSFPGAPGGAGTFNITVQPPNPPCRIDDGSSEELAGWPSGGEMVWIQRFGSASGSTSLSSVQISWGSPAHPGVGPGNTSPAKVVVYDDPNDDGNPSDAVLVQLISTTVTNVDTDTFNTYPVTPVSLNGYFFVGAGLPHAAGQFVAPMDKACVQPVLTYFFGNNTGGPAIYNNPSGNAFPPESFDNDGNPANLMVRAGCTSSPMLQHCFPGQGGIIACPCGNPPAGGGLGCNNFGTGPANSGTLAASGVASLGSDSVILHATGENNTSTTVFWTGKTPVHSTGVVHGAGVRCATASLKRLYPIPGNGAAQASGGAVSRPGGPDTQSVSSRTATLYGTPIAPGETRLYFNIYRDPQAAGPCGNSASTVNLTNGGAIVWGL